jgi:asparagine synthase (glutamine-hydrolysing)
MTQAWKGALYGPVMTGASAGFDPGALMRVAYEKTTARDPIDRMLYADSQSRLPDHPVMIQDRMTMAHGLEARSPFMDHKIAEFAARLPVNLKVRGRTLRYIQVQLARRHLPPEVLARKKQGFSSALPYMLSGELALLYRVLLGDMRLARDGLLHQATVDRLVADHRRRAADHHNRLWLLLNAEAWYRLFIRRESRADLETEIGDMVRAKPERDEPAPLAAHA